MRGSIIYGQNKASENEIVEHLASCDENFVPHLSLRVALNEYSSKIYNNAVRFEAWSEGALVGLMATYCNDLKCGTAYITSVSVLADTMGRGVASRLMSDCIRHAESVGFQRLELEVDQNNTKAIRLYEKKGFVAVDVDDSSIIMRLDIIKES